MLHNSINNKADNRTVQQFLDQINLHKIRTLFETLGKKQRDLEKHERDLEKQQKELERQQKELERQQKDMRRKVSTAIVPAQRIRSGVSTAIAPVQRVRSGRGLGCSRMTTGRGVAPCMTSSNPQRDLL